MPGQLGRDVGLERIGLVVSGQAVEIGGLGIALVLRIDDSLVLGIVEEEEGIPLGDLMGEGEQELEPVPAQVLAQNELKPLVLGVAAVVQLGQTALGRIVAKPWSPGP